MHSTQLSRNLEDRHSAMAEAEEKGLKEIAYQANRIWLFHEVAVAALEDYLAGVQ